jgi:heparin binding hemagglutinin HbhA
MATTKRTTRSTKKSKPTAIDQAKTPLLAAIGAGDFALNTVLGAVTDARTRAEERAENTRERFSSIPEEIDELRGRLAPEELRKVAEAYVQAAAQIYVSLAERGGEALDRVRKTPQVDDLVSRAEDARDDAKDLSDEVLGTVARQTRSIGERAARATERVTTRATSVAGKAGAAAAEVGDELAHDLRSTSRRAANTASKQGSSTNARTTAAKKATAAKKTAAAKTTTARKTTARKATAAKTTAAKTADTASATAKDVKDTAVAAQNEATEKTTATS